ncbi:MAG: hypothetical protein IT495_01720 [Gammaproteobacteria bacterium]|nr:hypothetical protein [Gammaproteobacteria bacterium]
MAPSNRPLDESGTIPSTSPFNRLTPRKPTWRPAKTSIQRSFSQRIKSLSGSDPVTRLKEKRITLERLAAHPLITYDERHRLGRTVRSEFTAKGLKPNIVMSIIDDDIMKPYMEAGFGIAIMASAIEHMGKPDRCVMCVCLR